MAYLNKKARLRRIIAFVITIILFLAMFSSLINLIKAPDYSDMQLHTYEANIEFSNGTIVYLRGVNYPSGFTASCTGSFPGDDDWIWGYCYTHWNGVGAFPYTGSGAGAALRFAELHALGINAVRLIFNPDWWIANSSTNLDSQSTDLPIRTCMLNTARVAAQYGIYCIFAPWTSDQVPANQFASSAAFASFWTSVSSVLGAEPNVGFDLWNEPNTNPSENTWINTWCPAACSAIRANSNNLIFIQWGWCGGFDFADNVWSSCGSYGNIVMSDHIYRYPSGSTFATNSGTTTTVCNSTLINTWSYDSVIGQYPMYIGEIGAYTSQSGDTAWFTSCLSVLNGYNASYTAWEWGQDGTNWQLSTPTTASWEPNTNGQVLVNAISAGGTTGGQGEDEPTPSPSPTPTESPTPSPTESPTPSPSPTPTETPTPTPSPTPTPTPTPSPTPTPTPSPSPSPSSTPSPSPSPSPTPTETPTPTPTATPTPGTYTLSNPSPLLYSLVDSDSVEVYSGNNASYAINYCTQNGNTCHLLAGSYSDNGAGITIRLSSGCYLYGSASARIFIIAIGGSGRIGGFTWAGSP